MKKKNRSPLYCKPKIIDGIDVKNIHCYSYREMLEAEIKNHNAEIQYAIYDCLRSSRGDEKFKLDALKEFYKNKKFHETKIQERYQVMEREDNDVNFSYVKKRYIDGIAQDISIGKAERNAELPTVFVWKDITLNEGENSVRVTAILADGNTLEDSAVWTCS